MKAITIKNPKTYQEGTKTFRSINSEIEQAIDCQYTTLHLKILQYKPNYPNNDNDELCIVTLHKIFYPRWDELVSDFSIHASYNNLILEQNFQFKLKKAFKPDHKSNFINIANCRRIEAKWALASNDDFIQPQLQLKDFFLTSKETALSAFINKTKEFYDEFEIGYRKKKPELIKPESAITARKKNKTAVAFNLKTVLADIAQPVITTPILNLPPTEETIYYEINEAENDPELIQPTDPIINENKQEIIQPTDPIINENKQEIIMPTEPIINENKQELIPRTNPITTVNKQEQIPRTNPIITVNKQELILRTNPPISENKPEPILRTDQKVNNPNSNNTIQDHQQIQPQSSSIPKNQSPNLHKRNSIDDNKLGEDPGDHLILALHSSSLSFDKKKEIITKYLQMDRNRKSQAQNYNACIDTIFNLIDSDERVRSNLKFYLTNFGFPAHQFLLANIDLDNPNSHTSFTRGNGQKNFYNPSFYTDTLDNLMYGPGPITPQISQTDNDASFSDTETIKTPTNNGIDFEDSHK